MSHFCYTVGLDLGQQADYSALAVLEEQVLFDGWESPADMTPQQVTRLIDTPRLWPDRPPLHCRHLERFPLGTSYPEIVRETIALINRPIIRERGVALVIDATGVGRPVLDLFRQEGVAVIAVTITGGQYAHFDLKRREWTVPKRDLVSAVQSQLQTDRLRISASLTHAETLTRELLNFRVTINAATAHDSYGAWREGVHDDLVLATALACWYRDHYWQKYDRARLSRALEVAV